MIFARYKAAGTHALRLLNMLYYHHLIVVDMITTDPQIALGLMSVVDAGRYLGNLGP